MLRSWPKSNACFTSSTNIKYASLIISAALLSPSHLLLTFSGFLYVSTLTIEYHEKGSKMDGLARNLVQKSPAAVPVSPLYHGKYR